MLDKSAAERIYNSGKESTISKLIEQDARIDQLQDKIDHLSKNSGNSSKPPSSDIVKPSKKKSYRGRRKKKGGQLGHPKHEREAFVVEEITESHTYKLSSCPNCGGILTKAQDKKPRILQQVEIPEQKLDKIEHRADAYWCENCQTYHYKSFPEEIKKEGFFKEHISAMLIYLKYCGNMSHSAIVRYLRDTFEIKVSRGFVSKVIHKGARAVDKSYEELFEAIRNEPVVNADETGHKENGNRFWTWAFRSATYALFRISPSRSSEVLIETLGKEFNGVLGCDYFSAYRKYMRCFNVTLQFCLAHLIREIKALVDSHNRSLKNYGLKVLDALKKLFHIIHKRDSYASQQRFIKALQRQKEKVIKIITRYVPKHNKAQNIAKRFRKHADAYFEFITTPGLEPTNNCAEQIIRFVVIYRHMSQGTRSENGRYAAERFFSVIATCALQSRSAFSFIKEAIHNYCKGLSPPSLLSQTA
jgi:transposase